MKLPELWEYDRMGGLNPMGTSHLSLSCSSTGTTLSPIHHGKLLNYTSHSQKPGQINPINSYIKSDGKASVQSSNTYKISVHNAQLSFCTALDLTVAQVQKHQLGESKGPGAG